MVANPIQTEPKKESTRTASKTTARARLVLIDAARNATLGVWPIRCTRCLVGSSTDCHIRCDLPGIAPNHALIIIGARQMFVRWLAPDWDANGQPRHELLVEGDEAEFELAGHAFRLVREEGAGEQSSALMPPPKGLRFTQTRALGNRRKTGTESGADDPHDRGLETCVDDRSWQDPTAAHAAAGPSHAPPSSAGDWPLASLHSHVREAITPIEARLDGLTKPLEQLTALLQTFASEREVAVANDRHDVDATLSNLLADFTDRQRAEYQAFAEKLDHLYQQLATLDQRIVSLDANSTSADSAVSTELSHLAQVVSNLAAEFSAGIEQLDFRLSEFVDQQAVTRQQDAELLYNLVEQVSALGERWSQATSAQEQTVGLDDRSETEVCASVPPCPATNDSSATFAAQEETFYGESDQPNIQDAPRGRQAIDQEASSLARADEAEGLPNHTRVDDQETAVDTTVTSDAEHATALPLGQTDEEEMLRQADAAAEQPEELTGNADGTESGEELPAWWRECEMEADTAQPSPTHDTLQETSLPAANEPSADEAASADQLDVELRAQQPGTGDVEGGLETINDQHVVNHPDHQTEYRTDQQADYGEEYDPSIEEYMQQLLARLNKGAHSATPPKTSTDSTSTSPTSPATSATMAPAGAGKAEGILSPAGYADTEDEPDRTAASGAEEVGRWEVDPDYADGMLEDAFPSEQSDEGEPNGTTASEARLERLAQATKQRRRSVSVENLDALRTLANTTARTAIQKSVRRRVVHGFGTKLAIACGGMVVAGILFYLNGWNFNVTFVTALTAMLVGIIWGIDALMTIIPVIRNELYLPPRPPASHLHHPIPGAGEETLPDDVRVAESAAVDPSVPPSSEEIADPVCSTEGEQPGEVDEVTGEIDETLAPEDEWIDSRD
ncbi:MAG: hypothetical protein KatS3mg111_3499 [Pirellulaceae bacterium]|nr:MAG: hypothetical protein KatS3mg111_3499 [Pirellulaceae bacterium]